MAIDSYSYNALLKRLFVNRVQFRSLNSKAAFSSSVPLPETQHTNHYNYNLRGIYCNNNGILDSFDNIIHQCANGDFLKQIHAQIKITGLSDSPFLATRLVAQYGKFGFLSDARKVFDDIFERIGSVSGNMLLWNSILRVNVMHGNYTEVLRLYCKMRRSGVSPDGFGFPLIVKAVGGSITRDWGRKLAFSVHCHVMQLGYGNHVHVVNELLGMYGKLGRMDVALKVFDRMRARNQISWNVMVSGFANAFDCNNAYKMVSRMKSEGWEPNSVTWTSLLSSYSKCGRLEETLELYKFIREESNDLSAEAVALVLSVCADIKAFDAGRCLHSYVIKGGFWNYLFVGNSLISMYSKNDSLEDAHNAFSSLKAKNIVTWNALITSYAESGSCDEAFYVFSLLQNPDVNYPSVKPNVVSWTAVISAFAKNERFEESLDLFRQMQATYAAANSVTIASALTACAGLSALGLGKQIHAYVIRGLIVEEMLVGNGLINMYMKCGSLIEANILFDTLQFRDLYSWNTMIAGYAMLGLGNNALKLFYEKMMKTELNPDGVTFVGLLSACSHAGLVTEGRELFNQMEKDFGVKPQVEHYTCIVDLLSRAGLVHEAIDVVRNMEMKPSESVLGALLNSCKMHRYTDAVEETAALILSLDAKKGGTHMLLSNLYSTSGKWEDSAKVRMFAKIKGLKKDVGQSWIEVKKKVHAFSAGQGFDSERKEVEELLIFLSIQMKMESYVFGWNFGSLLFPREEYEA